MSDVVNSSLKTAAKGTTLILFGSSVSLPLWFATKILIIRNTTTEEFGIYSLALAVASIISVLATLGLQEGATRFVSVFLGEEKTKDASDASGSAIRISMISGAASFLLLFFLAGPAARYVFYMPELATPLRVISLFIPFFVMAQVIGAVLRGHNIIRPKVYYLDIGWPLFFMAFLCIMLVMGFPFISILYAYLFSAITVFVAISSYGYKKIGLNPFSIRARGHYSELIRFSLPLTAGGIAGMVLAWTDTFMLGRYMMAEDVGVYNVSISLARLLTFSLGALGFVFLPLAGKMHARGQHAELKRTYQVLTKWIFSITLPVFFILFLFPEMTITFFFGDSYVASSGPLSILSLGFLFHVFLGANGVILIVLGFSRAIMNISIFAAILNVALNYILIKRLGLGITGAAVATAVSYIALNIAISAVVYRESRIHPLTAKYLRPVAGSAAIGLVIYAIAKNLPLYFWMLPVYFVLFVGGYGAFLLLTRSIDKEDIVMLEAISARTGLKMILIRKVIYRFTNIAEGEKNSKN